ncbi:MAG: MFS transporter [Thalassobaculaceae bacterium]|nr:MFS transporter [Thalassobaculaceae bacterium]
MSVVGRLQLAGCGMHLADQIAIVGVPLVAALAFDASAGTIGILVACQSMAHLLGSLPSGLIIDRSDPRRVALAAVLISLLGFSGTAMSVSAGNLIGFGLCVTVAGFGIVLFTLAALSVLPKAVPAEQLVQANARIEIPRSTASLLVPLTIGLVISTGTVNWVFVVAAAGPLLALGVTIGLPHFAPSHPNGQNLLRRIAEGGAFVLANEFLLAISACALFWNFAFSALLATMVPLITEVYRMNPGTFGIAMAAFGLAAFLGSTLAARFAGRIRPNIVLLFGPGSSVPAALLLLAVTPAGSPLPIYAAFFLLGFGPSMWLIAQHTVRQLVSPRDMLGRVNAVIQTTIYGARPLGALSGGFLVAATSPRSALVFVALIYALSFAAAALSRLRSIRSYSELSAVEAA